MVAKHFLNLARMFGKKNMGMLTISTVEFGEHPNLSSPFQPAGRPWWQMAAAKLQFLVVETAPKTNISDISDVSRPHHFFCPRTSDLLSPGFLRKSRFFVPVQCLIGCCRTVLMTVLAECIFEIVPMSLQKMVR